MPTTQQHAAGGDAPRRKLKARKTPKIVEAVIEPEEVVVDAASEATEHVSAMDGAADALHDAQDQTSQDGVENSDAAAAPSGESSTLPNKGLNEFDLKLLFDESP